jgi:hypothetical protein
MALIILFVKLTSLLMLVMVINCGNSFDGCSKLSNSCRFEDGIDILKSRFETFVCDSLNTNFEMSKSEMTMCKKTPTAQTEVYFKLSIPQNTLALFNGFKSIFTYIHNIHNYENIIIFMTVCSLIL